MTQAKIQLPANLPEATVRSRIRQFLLSNTYYELESEGELRFLNYPEYRSEESPASIPHELRLWLTGNHLNISYRATTQSGYQVWDRLYQALLLKELRMAIETGEVVMLDLSQLEKVAADRLYRPVPDWLQWLKWAWPGISFFAVITLLASSSDNDWFADWRYWLLCGLSLIFLVLFRLRYRTPLLKGAEPLPNEKPE